MARFERSIVIDAPLQEVWEFHSTTDALEDLTPCWMGLEIGAVLGPEGERNPPELVEGTKIAMSAQPFGLVPGGSWVSRITSREYRPSEAHFSDEMVDGPFRHWVHTHTFTSFNGQTRMHDSLKYEFPWPMGGVSGLARPFFEAFFRYRHRQTRRLLEQ